MMDNLAYIQYTEFNEWVGTLPDVKDETKLVEVYVGEDDDFPTRMLPEELAEAKARWTELPFIVCTP